jgi:hypothetical protein
MSQSKAMSFLEAVVNTLVGLLIAYFAQSWFLKLLGVPISDAQNWALVGFMTVVSIARSYMLRRAFNSEFRLRWNGWLAMWKKQFFCDHDEGKIVEVTFDGETIIECSHCGKVFQFPL